MVKRVTWKVKTVVSTGKNTIGHPFGSLRIFHSITIKILDKHTMIESLIFFKFPYITSGNMIMRTRLRRNKLLTTRNSQIMQHVFANLYFISINSINILTKLTDSLAYKRASSQPIIRPPFAAAAKAPNSCFWFENKYIF